MHLQLCHLNPFCAFDIVLSEGHCDRDLNEATASWLKIHLATSILLTEVSLLSIMPEVRFLLLLRKGFFI